MNQIMLKNEEFKLKLFDSRSKSIKIALAMSGLNESSKILNELINSDFINIFNLKIISRKDEIQLVNGSRHLILMN